MIFTQYYLDCLSQASYLIGDESTGRAVVVDPRRDVGEYVGDAEAAGLTIELVIETHFHADFLSGHLELAEATGATIAFGEAARPEFAYRPLRDGERIELGEVVLEVRATPGHTPESISIVVYERAEDEVPYGVLTGDTLFIGDVGRPDLLASVGASAGDLARQLYDSLRTKLLTLPDATRVFPGHGAGSACGKNLSTATTSTIGEQRSTNYALQDLSAEEFVAIVTEAQPAAPAYFPYDATLNRRNRPLLHEDDPVPQLDVEQVLALQRGGAVVLDTRDPGAFTRGHLTGSFNVGLGGRFAEYVGTVVPHGAEVVLVGDPGTGAHARVRLARIGFDRVAGELADPLEVLERRPDLVTRASQVTAVQLRDRMAGGDATTVVDVRNPGEARLGTVPGARTVPLAQLVDRLGELDPGVPTVLYCAGGYRSSIAASVLRAAGFEDVSDLAGGYGAWQSLVARAAPTG